MNNHEHDHSHCEEHHHHHHCDENEEDLYGELNEVPAVFSYTESFELKKEAKGDKLQESFVHWIENLRKWSIENKHFIGHIKIFVKDEKDFNLWVATTGKKINVKTFSENNDYDIKNITVNMTAIVFGTDEETLKSVVLKKLDEELLCYMN
ncbi:hypothetical protein [Clostridium ljungdahlii]|uniref:Uncharacterized protein n=1 Tax=Clostridium ljungdahlii TaxID=1538 RepID=A0A168LAG5_9CLOT|nr:hypothetical protein [Clostridium ljungdahlii]OAA82889.1 hypothetical protein WY13_03957 [Clostridium ljungdahlii]